MARTPMDDGLREVLQGLYLRAYALNGIIQPACDAAGISRSTMYRWKEEYGDFARACDDALQAAVDAAELELRTRAVGGVEEPVLYKGEPVWRRDPVTGAVFLDEDFNPVPFVVHRRSDRLLEVYMKGHRKLYSDRQQLEHVGKDGRELRAPSVTVNYVLPEGRTEDDYAPDPDPFD